MNRMAEVAVRDAGQIADVLEAECWASDLVSTWDGRDLSAGDPEEIFTPAFVRAVERRGSPKALVTLRALSAVCSEANAKLASAAAQRLAARGVREPKWSAGAGHAEAVGAELMYEEGFDDGVSVQIEFVQPGAEPHVLGIYIDHNMGGLVKDVFVAGPPGEVREEMRQARDGVRLTARRLDLAEARARVEAGLYMLDHTLDPPVDEDVVRLRALIDARMWRLPDGFVLPDDYVEFSAEQRNALLGDFLASPDGERWRGDELAEDVVGTAIDFGADYNHGGPLRWSPVVVEIFMVSWLARKVAQEPAFFDRVADVLPDWVQYAGGRRGVPEARLQEAVDAVKQYRADMLESINDPEAWGPAKTLVLEAQGSGVDLADPAAVNEFIERCNRGLAA